MLPNIEIDLQKIKDNTKEIVRLCAAANMEVAGVTKSVCGDCKIAGALVEGGVMQIADSRIRNIAKMREAGLNTEFMLLRSPGRSSIEETVKYADITLLSEMEIIKSIGKEAVEQGTEHGAVLMADLGDRREGVLPKDMVDLATLTMEVEGIRLEGVGTNLACYCGVIPTSEKMMELSRMVHKLEDSLGVQMRMVSGGNSANIPLLLDEGHPPEINHLRIGEAIMLGVETVNRGPIPGMHQDAFRIHGEVVESKDKPSTPNGEIGQDAFGNTPVVEDRGIIHEALIALGRQDVLPGSLEPEMSSLDILGANSDFIIVDPGEEKMKVGDTLTFIPGYGSLLQAMTSPYVEKKYENGHRGHPRKRMDVNA